MTTDNNLLARGGSMKMKSWIIYVTKVTVAKASFTVDAEDKDAAWDAIESFDADSALEWDEAVVTDVSYEVEGA